MNDPRREGTQKERIGARILTDETGFPQIFRKIRENLFESAAIRVPTEPG